MGISCLYALPAPARFTLPCERCMALPWGCQATAGLGVMGPLHGVHQGPPCHPSQLKGSWRHWGNPRHRASPQLWGQAEAGLGHGSMGWPDSAGPMARQGRASLGQGLMALGLTWGAGLGARWGDPQEGRQGWQCPWSPERGKGQPAPVPQYKLSKCQQCMGPPAFSPKPFNHGNQFQ